MNIKKTRSFIPFLLLLNTLSLFSAAPLVENEENTTERADVTYYEHGDIVDPTTFKDPTTSKDTLRKEKFYQMLPVMYDEGYNRYGTSTYFFFGATGSGKSASIFTLQGNKVELIDEDEEEDDDDEDEDDDNASEIKFTKIVSVPSPVVGSDSSAGTVRSHIYYHPHQKMAFCDTEGFSGVVEMTNEEKCLSSFSPYFCLKTNPIGGIIFVLSEPNIISGRGDVFKKSVGLLKNYLSKEKMTDMKKSILILITKIKSKRKILKKKLKSHVKLAYKDFYKQQDPNKKPDEKSMAGLKPFFQILLKGDVAKQDIDNNGKYVFDMEKFVFLYPGKKESVEEAMQKIRKLTPIKKEKLSKFDNSLYQYMEERVKEMGNNFDKELKGIVSRGNRIKTLEKVIQKKQGSGNFQELVDDLETEIDKIERENKELKEDESLECVFDDDHIEIVPEGCEANMRTIKEIRAKKSTISTIRAILFPPLAIVAGVVYYGYAGYFVKKFTYTSKEPIFRIALNYRHADFTFCNPDDKFIKDQFIEEKSEEKSEEGVENRVLVSKTRKGITKDTWEFLHATHLGENAKCTIKLYCKKNQHSITKQKIIDNKKDIKSSKREIENIRSLQNSIETLQARLGVVTKEKKEREIKIRERAHLVRMLACWTKHVLKENSLVVDLLNGYINKFKEITQIDINKLPKINELTKSQEGKPTMMNASNYDQDDEKEQLK